MIPSLNGIDHAHVFVTDLKKARQWYCDMLGFVLINPADANYQGTGPLKLKDPADTIHLALFKSDQAPSSILAFGCKGKSFLQWINYLNSNRLETRLADHKTAWSLYFKDPFGNQHEITTTDYDEVTGQITNT